MLKTKIAIFAMLLGVPFSSDAATPADGAEARADEKETAGDYVVLLHGMHRTRGSMKRLEWQLKAAGYQVINKSYPSRSQPIEQIANGHLKDLVAKYAIDPERKVHFVTHSLGGIVVRQFLADNPLPNLGRVVMLAPPNQGSELTDTFRRIPIYKYIMGPSAMQLGTTEDDRPIQLGRVDFDLGVIAGDRSLNPLYSAIIDGQDDGKVSVERARVEGMADFYVTHTSHTWLMNRRSVISQIKHFIETGAFETDAD